MNSEAKKLIDRRLQETVEALGGEGEYRLHALRHLRLKTVVKESHGAPTHALAFNHATPGCSNLLASTGGDQATVYDDEHMGDHLSLVVHFVNTKTDYTEGGGLQSLCWLPYETLTTHTHGDACLAVSGTDPAISIISVVESKVVKLLKGHTVDVVDMSAALAPPRSNALVSLSRDGNVRLWDVVSGNFTSSFTVDGASAIAITCHGDVLAIGTAHGHVYLYDVTTADNGVCSIDESMKRRLEGKEGKLHSHGIDCLRFLPDRRLVSKSADGLMLVRNVDSQDIVVSWKVPDCSGSGGFNSRCQFSATADGKYIAVGNTYGECFVYDSETGNRQAHVAAIKVSAPVRACALSNDCRHLLAAIGKGFIFRFEYLGIEEGDETGKSMVADANSGEKVS